jgi:hypothetical protein
MITKIDNKSRKKSYITKEYSFLLIFAKQKSCIQ